MIEKIHQHSREHKTTIYLFTNTSLTVPSSQIPHAKKATLHPLRAYPLKPLERISTSLKFLRSKDSKQDSKLAVDPDYAHSIYSSYPTNLPRKSIKDLLHRLRHGVHVDGLFSQYAERCTLEDTRTSAIDCIKKQQTSKIAPLREQTLCSNR